MHAWPQVDILAPPAQQPFVGRKRDAVHFALRAARVVACATVQYQQRPHEPYTSRKVTTWPTSSGVPSTSAAAPPIAATRPTLTWPGMIGYGTPASCPCHRCTSVPHTSLPRVCSSTAPGSSAGSANCRSSSGPRPGHYNCVDHGDASFSAPGALRGGGSISLRQQGLTLHDLRGFGGEAAREILWRLSATNVADSRQKEELWRACRPPNLPLSKRPPNLCYFMLVHFLRPGAKMSKKHGIWRR